MQANRAYGEDDIQMTELDIGNSHQKAIIDDYLILHLKTAEYHAQIHDRQGKTLCRKIMEIYLNRKLERTERVIYKNGDVFDNRIENLKVVSYSDILQRKHKQKTPTTSQYKGVHWDKKVGKWRAKITTNGKCISLGFFANEDEAARAYDEGTAKYFGKCARPNKRSNIS
jgi:hypothetical protein